MDPQATSGAFEVAKWLVEELRIQRIQLKGSGMIFHDTPFIAGWFISMGKYHL